MARRGGKVSLSVDEVISTLKHSFLPTVVTEGEDDIIVFRRLEDTFASVGLSVLSVGGRDSVLKIYERRHEFAQDQKIAFIADRDMWVLTGVPEAYQADNLLFTTGYSVENDVFIDGELEGLLTHPERAAFQRELSEFTKWYAIAAHRFINGFSQDLSLHPNTLFKSEEHKARFMSLTENETYPEELFREIMSDYGRYLRGKSLMAVLLRHLSYPGRSVRHNDRSLIEMVANKRGPHLQQIYNQVGALFIE